MVAWKVGSCHTGMTGPITSRGFGGKRKGGVASRELSVISPILAFYKFSLIIPHLYCF